MAAIRVTQRIIVDRTLNNIADQLLSLLKLQDQLATGRRINSPSDNPLDARRGINARTLLGKNRQFLNNIESVRPQLLEASTAIETAVDIMQRVRELTLQGASGTNAQSQLNLIATEIDQLLEGVFEQSNQKTNGRSVFAGTRTLTPAFSATRDPVSNEITAVSYDGNDQFIQITVGESVNVNLNIPGSEVFLGTEDVFQLLIDIRDDLRAGDQASLRNSRIGQLDTVLDQLLTPLAKMGTLQNRLERLSAKIDDGIVQLQRLMSDVLDADLAEVIVNLNAQTNAFQAALSAGARVIVPSLLDFIQ